MIAAEHPDERTLDREAGAAQPVLPAGVRVRRVDDEPAIRMAGEAGADEAARRRFVLRDDRPDVLERVAVAPEQELLGGDDEGAESAEGEFEATEAAAASDDGDEDPAEGRPTA